MEIGFLQMSHLSVCNFFKNISLLINKTFKLFNLLPKGLALKYLSACLRHNNDLSVMQKVLQRSNYNSFDFIFNITLKPKKIVFYLLYSNFKSK